MTSSPFRTRDLARPGPIAIIGLCCAQFTHPKCHVTLTHWFRPHNTRLPMDSKRSLVEPEPNPTKSPAKKLLKYVVSLGLLWYILHRWLFQLAFNSATHDLYPWALDAFAPKERGPSNTQLAENFFLLVLPLSSYSHHTDKSPQVLYRIRPAQLSHLVDMPQVPTLPVHRKTYARPRTSSIPLNTSSPSRKASSTPYFQLVQRRHVTRHSLSRI